jgi:hypothetical protein
MARARRKAVSADLVQISLLAPWVIGARMMSAMTKLRNGRIDHREGTRMWTEKGAAFAESWLKANAALARVALAPPFSAASGRALQAWADSFTGPARRRVVRNARRLSAKGRKRS